MGLSALGALLATIAAFVAQSPQLITRMRLGGSRLDLRARTFTGYALALLLLTGGFFLAGVPLETQPVRTTAVTVSPAVVVADDAVVTTSIATGTVDRETAVSDAPTPARTPQSGAFGGPPPTVITDTVAAPPPDESPSATAAVSLLTTTPSSPTAARPTSTATHTPTVTATPTLTPTPIEGETAVINTGTSTLWALRAPGGQQLVLVRGGETVILQPGHANQGGVLWQEVMTLDGEIGWVQAAFLTQAEEEAAPP